jgi:hypothetical protein
MSSIVDPKELAVKKRKGLVDHEKLDAELHDHTFGKIRSRFPRAHDFAIALPRLTHYCDFRSIGITILAQQVSPQIH